MSRVVRLAVLAVVFFTYASATFPAEIAWIEQPRDAIEIGAANDRPVLVDVWAVWCAPCQYMEEHTYGDPDVIETVLASFVPLKVNADAQEVFAERYRADVLPTTMILDGDGRVLARRQGLLEAGPLRELMRLAAEGYPGYLARRAQEDRPAAMIADAEYLLALHNGDRAAGLLRKCLKRMRDDDPERVDFVRILLAEAQVASGRHAPAVATLEKLSKTGASDQVRARSLGLLAHAERDRGRADAARAASDRLRTEYPDLASLSAPVEE